MEMDPMEWFVSLRMRSLQPSDQVPLELPEFLKQEEWTVERREKKEPFQPFVLLGLRERPELDMLFQWEDVQKPRRKLEPVPS